MDKTYTHKRTCRICHIEKPISEYCIHKGKPETMCKSCKNAYYRERYASQRRNPYNPPTLPIVKPVICPCGKAITSPTNGVWLCPDCAPTGENKSQLRNVEGVSMRMHSNCWSCKYLQKCEQRVTKGLPILCEVTLEKERIPLPNLFAFSTTG